VEALVRWRHPERGLVDTAEMILTAEASGMIQLLTLRVLDDVLTQLQAWVAAGVQLRASVNVSAKDFASAGFADQVELRLQRHKVAPHQLELEITESALVAASPRVDRTVADLVAMGVGLSLDDFGTGFASLQQLRRYPLRELKIDRSYVTALATSPADRAVVTSITQLATDLGLRVVAEGVEDASTAALLGQIGPIIGQGWLYGRPMSAEDLMAWINARPDRD
jgi:diguanylate cyclase